MIHEYVMTAMRKINLVERVQGIAILIEWLK